MNARQSSYMQTDTVIANLNVVGLAWNDIFDSTVNDKVRRRVRVSKKQWMSNVKRY